MKKIIKLPDGTEEVYEGTPEELAELEKKLRESTPREQSGKKRVLNEERVSALHDCCRHGGSCKNFGCCEHKMSRAELLKIAEGAAAEIKLREMIEDAVRKAVPAPVPYWPQWPWWGEPIVYGPLKVEPTWTTSSNGLTMEPATEFVAGGVCASRSDLKFKVS